jgi:vacuolar-type H+-ATPase subunit I/STV1
MDQNKEDLSKSFEEFQSKMDLFSSILEKFGLDIITKMGQTNLKITQLTDKINNLDKATIDIKSLIPQLSNVIENQKFLEDELDLIKSLLKNMGQISSKKKEVENSVDRNEAATSKKDIILNQFNDLRENLEALDDPIAVKPILEQVKEDIFEFTGGHRILYEISQVVNRLNSASSLNDLMDEQDTTSVTIKDYLKEKITFWNNKFMIKD